MSHEQAASLFSAGHSVSMPVSESGEISLGMKFTPTGNMLEMEEAVSAAVNAFGAALTEHCPALYDADGSRLQIGKTTYCSCGQFPQTYKTPYGGVNVMRYAYQSAEGGGRYVPLESRARMVLNSSTPRFAKTAASKTANMPPASVQTDLFDNHDVSVSRDYLTKLSDKAGELIKNSEPFIKYDDAKDLNKDEIKTISVSLDGTALLLKDKDKKPAFREAMAGVVSLTDKDGGRRSAVYAGEAPEYGKETFLERLELEPAGAESLFPDAAVQG
ncbi:MAG: hypothetical protein LBP22_04600, partial [Deltaproteobacteria bacterium]|nr:hypothetical protein [Deltaproteobacteria bacterium]